MRELKSMVEEAFALKVAYTETFPEDDLAAEKMFDKLGVLVKQIAPRSAEWGEARAAIEDVHEAMRHSARSDLPEPGWCDAYDDMELAFVDLGLELDLVGARSHHDQIVSRRRALQLREHEKERHGGREIASMRGELAACVLSLGDVPWATGQPGMGDAGRLFSLGATLGFDALWGVPSQLAVRTRRAARTIARLRATPLTLTASAWSDVRRAVRALASAQAPRT